ncbi:NAD(P)/FAD-dependent oxidoreductase [Mesorhizobium sp. M7A.F.Ca.ET.027.03.2.1]|uniref:NAD(P)/FAD-dependent oxidoreductase n=1 Tax=Mesorhizobium sp. M7A.F.Ca.ET.027.03.2.1 TaxID=2496656 RepID=UPI000FCC44F7|nr:NAD(P)/FAD-dependent oxidoreductase [Mesorhizobium sp. M7A.F.Ca.ET.027.03.2.1]RVD66743.1 NAD(P)/FAD-dependent oxidoreductase [Mesorhizobium sp. M7A.F.Ca.ET.027.03.2.1]
MLESCIGQRFDVAVVGAGPAGLAAAVYLARFLRSVVVFDAGDARALLIPRTRNCPGFPEGIAGKDLLQRLGRQAKAHGVVIGQARVEGLDKRGRWFRLRTPSGITTASRVILATGIVDKAPAIKSLAQAIANGSVRLCPVCDAYEARGKRLGVVGNEHLALKEALFLKDYSPHVAMLFNYPEDVSRAIRDRAARAGIAIWDRVDDLIPRPPGIMVEMASGAPARELDVIYPSMGCDVRSELATALGADCDETGYVRVGENLESSVPGLYAIGDVAAGLNQIAVAFGQAALAATHIHKTFRSDGVAAESS